MKDPCCIIYVGLDLPVWPPFFPSCRFVSRFLLLRCQEPPLVLTPPPSRGFGLTVQLWAVALIGCWLRPSVSDFTQVQSPVSSTSSSHQWMLLTTSPQSVSDISGNVGKIAFLDFRDNSNWPTAHQRILSQPVLITAEKKMCIEQFTLTDSVVASRT